MGKLKQTISDSSKVTWLRKTWVQVSLLTYALLSGPQICWAATQEIAQMRRRRRRDSVSLVSDLSWLGWIEIHWAQLEELLMKMTPHGSTQGAGVAQTPVSARPRQWRATQGPACPLPSPSHLLIGGLVLLWQFPGMQWVRITWEDCKSINQPRNCQWRP